MSPGEDEAEAENSRINDGDEDDVELMELFTFARYEPSHGGERGTTDCLYRKLLQP